MCLLGVLAAVALVNCGLPRTVAWPVAVLAAGRGLAQARRGLRQPARRLRVPLPPAAADVDGSAIQALLFWPDTLPRARRRELRLAVRAHAVSR